jgi:hypothetical protein
MDKRRLGASATHAETTADIRQFWLEANPEPPIHPPTQENHVMMQFAAVEAAMIIRRQAFTEYMAIREPQRNDRAARDVWRQATEGAEAAEAVVNAAYASELLPAVLGGAWTRTDAALKVPAPRTFTGTELLYGHGQYYHDLLDHPLHFRRRGTSGMLTLKDGAVIGRPYNAFDKAGVLLAAARRAARDLAARYYASVWARPDLSSWYPGWTALVVVARGLEPGAAERFGFVALAEERQTTPCP